MTEQEAIIFQSWWEEHKSKNAEGTNAVAILNFSTAEKLFNLALSTCPTNSEKVLSEVKKWIEERLALIPRHLDSQYKEVRDKITELEGKA